MGVVLAATFVAFLIAVGVWIVVSVANVFVQFCVAIVGASSEPRSNRPRDRMVSRAPSKWAPAVTESSCWTKGPGA
jgi:hypothetical protein